MSENVGIYTHIIDAYLCDFKGKATLPMLGSFMLQAATKHAEERGFGFNSMTDMKRIWVLSRLAVEIVEYPKNDAKIKLYTWISDVNKIFTERSFEFKDDTGKTLGYARSIWASIDLETRRPTNLLELEGLSTYNTGHPCPIEGMKKIIPLKDSGVFNSFEVKYSDIDINKHLNSMKYIEHYVDQFNIDMFVGKEIRRFEINYLNESQYGDVIELSKKEEANNVYILEMKTNGTVVNSARISWQ